MKPYTKPITRSTKLKLTVTHGVIGSISFPQAEVKRAKKEEEREKEKEKEREKEKEKEAKKQQDGTEDDNKVGDLT